MRALVKLFGRSPFAPLRNHMERVQECVERLPELFEAVKAGDADRVAETAKTISRLEHEADLAKNDIRNGLKTSLFLPVARTGLLDVLTLQDALADSAEDIAVLLTFRKPELPQLIAELFTPFLQKNLETTRDAAKIVYETQELLESSFGGAEAEKVRGMVDQVAYEEHRVDVMQRELVRAMFNAENELPFTAFHLWMRVIEEVGKLSNIAEKLANRLLMTLEVK